MDIMLLAILMMLLAILMMLMVDVAGYINDDDDVSET